jgi:REP element-mobilizing transposase RayT
MAGTYSQIYIQIVFAVKGRANLLKKPWRTEVFKYIAGVIREKGQKPIIVNGVSDHIHVFVGMKPSMSISDLVRDIKNNSSKFINESGFLKRKFAWQAGFGAFSYSQSAVGNVYRYIENQEAHHAKQTFKEEYLQVLETFEVAYDERYLFDWINTSG